MSYTQGELINKLQSYIVLEKELRNKISFLEKELSKSKSKNVEIMKVVKENQKIIAQLSALVTNNISQEETHEKIVSESSSEDEYVENSDKKLSKPNESNLPELKENDFIEIMNPELEPSPIKVEDKERKRSEKTLLKQIKEDEFVNNEKETTSSDSTSEKEELREFSTEEQAPDNVESDLSEKYDKLDKLENTEIKIIHNNQESTDSYDERNSGIYSSTLSSSSRRLRASTQKIIPRTFTKAKLKQSVENRNRNSSLSQNDSF